ncbi:MAG: hypothetical protein ABJZ55_11565 [Fuerstiella sp.]
MNHRHVVMLQIGNVNKNYHIDSKVLGNYPSPCVFFNVWREVIDESVTLGQIGV